VKIVKSTKVKIKPFILSDFTQTKAMRGSIKKITKKTVKNLANELGLAYDEKQIAFTKKIMTEYLER
jgi:2-hydroxy-3-keto-5-methylthiopentenyl-1-phosphate phosphatase